MRSTITAFKVAAWMLLRDLMEARGLSKEWLRERLGDRFPPFDSWLQSSEQHRVGEYCELILEAEKMPPEPEAEPFDAGFVDLFRKEEYREHLPGTLVAEATTTTDAPDPHLMLLDLAFRGVFEDVRQGRRSAEDVVPVLRGYLDSLLGYGK